MKKYFWVALVLVVIFSAAFAFYYFVLRSQTSNRSAKVIEWIRHPEDHPEWAMQALQQCDDAPFTFPTHGFVGYLWDDSFRPGHRHQGLDIFGGSEAGLTPVYAAADGYLTREVGWKSTVIIRIPHDPLHPQNQIWTYYTHMADPNGKAFIVDDFPPGTAEMFVKAGTLLGYQGNYSGTNAAPTGVHLHFSIVKDDGQGNYLNELEIENTLDPSQYFGMQVNAKNDPAPIPLCQPSLP